MPRLTTCSDALDDPNRVVSRIRSLVARARAENRAILHVYTLPGDVVSIGRFHVVPDLPASGGFLRRLAGGRAAPLGDGYVGVSLALPHRSALVSTESGALAPDQILNRAVRGLLGALERLGVRAYYPGRDVVTAQGRVLAALGFEVADDGATLVEMSVATTRSFAEVARFADRADPAGVVPLELLLPDGATSIAGEQGDVPDLAGFAATLASGFAERLGVTVDDEREPLPPAVPDLSWLASGRLAAELTRRAMRRTMLGFVQAFVACAADRVSAVRLCGDFIAPSGTVERLEQAFRGAPIDPSALRDRVHEAVSGADFVLGLRDLELFADLVHEACTS